MSTPFDFEKECQQLLQYLPKFVEKKEIYPVATLNDIRLEDGILISLDYSPWVEDFFGRVARFDLPTRPSSGQMTLRTPRCVNTVQSSSMKELSEMLILILRTERFCSGYWEHAIQSGMIVWILRRMDDLDKAG